MCGELLFFPFLSRQSGRGLELRNVLAKSQSAAKNISLIRERPVRGFASLLYLAHEIHKFLSKLIFFGPCCCGFEILRKERCFNLPIPNLQTCAREMETVEFGLESKNPTHYQARARLQSFAILIFTSTAAPAQVRTFFLWIRFFCAHKSSRARCKMCAGGNSGEFVHNCCSVTSKTAANKRSFRSVLSALVVKETSFRF